MDLGSDVNELLLQSKGITVLKRSILCVFIWVCFDTAFFPAAPLLHLVCFLPHPLSANCPMHLKCIRFLSQLMYQLIWFLLAICIVWKDRARDAIMVYLFQRLIKKPGCALQRRCITSLWTHSAIRTNLKKIPQRSVVVLLLPVSLFALINAISYWDNRKAAEGSKPLPPARRNQTRVFKGRDLELNLDSETDEKCCLLLVWA